VMWALTRTVHKRVGNVLGGQHERPEVQILSEFHIRITVLQIPFPLPRLFVRTFLF